MAYRLTLFLITLLIVTLTSCKPSEPVRAPGDRPAEADPLSRFFDESGIFSQSTTGFVLYDPEADSTLYDRDGSRYFTPASNMKIFTLYASLKALPDTLPSLRYTAQNDTLRFRGTGDPAFLNPNFEPNGVYDFLKNRD